MFFQTLLRSLWTFFSDAFITISHIVYVVLATPGLGFYWLLIYAISAIIILGILGSVILCCGLLSISVEDRLRGDSGNEYRPSTRNDQEGNKHRSRTEKESLLSFQGGSVETESTP